MIIQTSIYIPTSLLYFPDVLVFFLRNILILPSFSLRVSSWFLSYYSLGFFLWLAWLNWFSLIWDFVFSMLGHIFLLWFFFFFLFHLLFLHSILFLIEILPEIENVQAVSIIPWNHICIHICIHVIFPQSSYIEWSHLPKAVIT